MAAAEPSGDRRSRLYLLRLWREHAHAPLRLALRRSGCDDLVGFADLDELMAFLADEAEACGGAAADERPAG
jgi:hypothetical protein